MAQKQSWNRKGSVETEHLRNFSQHGRPAPFAGSTKCAQPAQRQVPLREWKWQIGISLKFDEFGDHKSAWWSLNLAFMIIIFPFCCSVWPGPRSLPRWASPGKTRSPWWSLPSGSCTSTRLICASRPLWMSSLATRSCAPNATRPHTWCCTRCSTRSANFFILILIFLNFCYLGTKWAGQICVVEVQKRGGKATSNSGWAMKFGLKMVWCLPFQNARDSVHLWSTTKLSCGRASPFSQLLWQCSMPILAATGPSLPCLGSSQFPSSISTLFKQFSYLTVLAKIVIDLKMTDLIFCSNFNRPNLFLYHTLYPTFL